MDPQPPPAPSRKQIRRRIFWVALVVALVAALPFLEVWRAKHEWNVYVRSREAKGLHLSYKTFAPPPVPDEENFAMTPLLQPLYPNGMEYAKELVEKFELPDLPGKPLDPFGNRQLDKYVDLEQWKAAFGGQDVLVALKKFGPELAEISAAVRRPYSHFPSYEKYESVFPWHWGVLVAFAKIYALRAAAELREGMTDDALNDVETMQLLSLSMSAEPDSDVLWRRMDISDCVLQVVWEGLQDRRWSDAQLSRLQGILAREDFLKNLAQGLRGDLMISDEGLLLQKDSATEILSNNVDEEYLPRTKKIISHIPGGLLFYQNLLGMNLASEKYFALVDPVARRVYPPLYFKVSNDIADSTIWHVFGRGIVNPFMILAGSAIPHDYLIYTHASYEQASYDEAVVACALERFRLARGKFPDALQDLVPTWLRALPKDMVTGGPLHYRTVGAEGYFLFSTGWDRTDESEDFVAPDGVFYPENNNWPWIIKPR